MYLKNYYIAATVTEVIALIKAAVPKISPQTVVFALNPVVVVIQQDRNSISGYIIR